MTTVPTNDRPARGRVATAALTIGGFVVLLWAIELVDTILGHRLDGFGIRPRSLDGLVGVVFAPLLHGGWAHLIANTGPLLVLGFVILLSGVRVWAQATAVIWVIGGVGTWLIAGAGSIHLGASVLVFGWTTFLIFRGFFARRWGQIAVGIIILIAYGSVLWGVFPGDAGISWQGHLFGAIGGVVAARIPGATDDGSARTLSRRTSPE